MPNQSATLRPLDRGLLSFVVDGVPSLFLVYRLCGPP